MRVRAHDRLNPAFETRSMRTFETLYHVPATHRLVPVRSRSRGGRHPATYWEHEEYDALGRLIARYQSFAESTPKIGIPRSGWRKYDDGGSVIDQGAGLPFGLDEVA